MVRKLSGNIAGKLSGNIAGNNAESVGKFQPRVCFETLGSKVAQEILRNSEGSCEEFCGYETATQLLQSCVFEK